MCWHSSIIAPRRVYKIMFVFLIAEWAVQILFSVTDVSAR